MVTNDFGSKDGVNFEIYHNPARDYVNVKLDQNGRGDIQYEIFSLNGTQMQHGVSRWCKN